MQSSHTRFNRSHRISLAATLFILTIAIIQTASVAAQETGISLFEISLGGEARQLSSSADWSSKYYIGGNLTVTMNLFAGLSIEGGRGIGYGENLDTNSFEYGSHRILNGALRPAIYTSFLGLRYTVPTRRIRSKGLFGTDFIMLGAGMLWDRFYIRSDEYWYYPTDFGWQTNEIGDSHTGDRKDTAADIDGYYVSLAGRWNLLGSDDGNATYGIDGGLRYLFYSDSELAKDTLDAVPGSLSAAQVFVNLFVKMDLFY